MPSPAVLKISPGCSPDQVMFHRRRSGKLCVLAGRSPEPLSQARSAPVIAPSFPVHGPSSGQAASVWPSSSPALVHHGAVPSLPSRRDVALERRPAFSCPALGGGLLSRGPPPPSAHLAPSDAGGDGATRAGPANAHPAWGGRKLHHRLVAQGLADVPAPSTITDVLRRAGMLVPPPPPVPLQRFTHPGPQCPVADGLHGASAIAAGSGASLEPAR